MGKSKKSKKTTQIEIIDSASDDESIPDTMNEDSEEEAEEVEIVELPEYKKLLNASTESYIQIQILLKKLKQTHSKLEKEFKKLEKIKKKSKKPRKNTKSGINAKLTVPETLCEYLELDEDTKLERHQVTKKLYAKFKERGIQKGQNITLDEETAELFNKEEDETIHMFTIQKLLKTIYNNV